ncbi:uncharacterized protein [Notamacropus eugenii]|uniref:uncharacterized protein isoform X9 n=1 Tax=Notamacropus eugenii TaxID=9315 RepID=UPI003B674620
MGYDIERFVGYVNEGLLCCICQGVLEDPLQAPCEHAFCTSCIHGWLEYHRNCPEDRQALSCPVPSEQLHLSGHLSACEHLSGECPKGYVCTVLILLHNGITELRSELKLLRSEKIDRIEEAMYEVASRLDSQKRHLAQKESLLQNKIVELKSQVSQMMSSVQSLIAANTQFLQELEQAKVEKQKLMELLKSLQDCSLTAADGNEKPTSFHSLTQLESVRKKTQEGDNHLKKVLPSAST